MPGGVIKLRAKESGEGPYNQSFKRSKLEMGEGFLFMTHPGTNTSINKLSKAFKNVRSVFFRSAPQKNFSKKIEQSQI
jgi:hypothetical protein